jgi:hypothetical protein
MHLTRLMRTMGSMGLMGLMGLEQPTHMPRWPGHPA